ncbi:MAG: twin-arginine translocase TatA/TatE family subunit [Microlunatus sp.]|nr:twin-arginine translocase TatA/TatE family subunit [Microlunatus sp.]
MTPLAFDLGSSELVIILVIALVLFGGSRLAGLGKSAGRAIREFKDETRNLTEAESKKADQGATTPAATTSEHAATPRQEQS